MLIVSSTLAILHHLFISGFIGTQFGMYVFLKLQKPDSNLNFLRKLNLWTIGLIASTIVVGIMRVFWAEKVPNYYLNSSIFWVKSASVLSILAYSIYIHQIINKPLNSQEFRKIYKAIFIQMHILPIAIICAVFLAKGFN